MSLRFHAFSFAVLMAALPTFAQYEFEEKAYFSRPQDAEACIGGERCGGSGARLRIGLENRPVIEIVFRAHDDIGRAQNGTLRVKIDDEIIESRLQIAKEPEVYRLNVSSIRGEELIIETASNDEVEVFDVQVRYGSSGGSGGKTTVRCESRGGRETFCPADTSRGVKLVTQLSLSPCEKGDSWDYDRKGITVRDGCRADFEVRSGSTATPSPTPDPIILCESTDGKKKTCKADTRGGVTLHKKLSKASCTKGTSWDYDSKSVWVSNGCRAEFKLGTGTTTGGVGSLPPLTGGSGQSIPPLDTGSSQTKVRIKCESKGDKRKECPADIGSKRVKLVDRLSGSGCTKGEDWDYSRDRIWVTHGCRAVFEIE